MSSFEMPTSLYVNERGWDDGSSYQIFTARIFDGYVGARAVSRQRIKFQVRHGNDVCNHDLPNDGRETFFPVNMGSGEYVFRIMENIEGSTYAEADSIRSDIRLRSRLMPYLVPNVYCDYDGGSACVRRAYGIAHGCQTDIEVVRNVCDDVARSVSYDYEKAKRLSGGHGYVPSPDETLATGRGICFDYASLTAAMLRSLRIPARVVIGRLMPEGLYHAWVVARRNGRWVRRDVTLQSVGDRSQHTYENTHIY